MARKVKGEGIETPAFLPPLAAAIIALLIHPSAGVAVIAYVSGSMGALIGADLSNLNGITETWSAGGQYWGSGYVRRRFSDGDNCGSSRLDLLIGS